MTSSTGTTNITKPITGSTKSISDISDIVAKSGYSTLTDVETQWDLYLANTYSIIELQTRDFEREQMPKEWFDDWLRRVA